MFNQEICDMAEMPMLGVVAGKHADPRFPFYSGFPARLENYYAVPESVTKLYIVQA